MCIAIILNKFSILGSSADWVLGLYGSTTAAGHGCGHANYGQGNEKKKEHHTHTHTHLHNVQRAHTYAEKV